MKITRLQLVFIIPRRQPFHGPSVPLPLRRAEEKLWVREQPHKQRPPMQLDPHRQGCTSLNQNMLRADSELGWWGERQPLRSTGSFTRSTEDMLSHPNSRYRNKYNSVVWFHRALSL